MEFEAIKNQVLTCTKCCLCKSRTQAVPGKGNPRAELLLIGEAPGANEDIQGVPFCGKSGAVLDKLLESVGFSRDDIFITNVVKCRPPENRAPSKAEIQTCKPYLEAQINAIKPKKIASLGRFAMEFLTQKYNLPKETITQAHGKGFTINTVNGPLTIVHLFHPAVAVYDPTRLPELKEDFQNLTQDIHPHPGKA